MNASRTFGVAGAGSIGCFVGGMLAAGGRRTEIDYLQGVITAIAERRGLNAPLSHRIVELIRKAEVDGKGSRGLSPEQIRA